LKSFYLNLNYEILYDVKIFDKNIKNKEKDKTMLKNKGKDY